ncbi:hypothetical protein AVEN_179684-1 [Araneus ventricosus]|uniref:Tc1-like transposase DDE domain-containing protein n=1 Tax=Araneus ventricosus TaxID=182803 RepID=A0A4Y1ZP51_ARAVE|nr:hypothetical protein AVEN_179684-1 [Araneus ventricosus]
MTQHHETLRTVNDERFLSTIVFSDETTFHVCVQVHRHNVRVWAAENPRAYVEYKRNTPKVNVWCALMHDKVIGPFFFAEPTVTSNIYLGMLQLYAVPQFPEGVIFQQEGAPPHYGNIVCEFLNTAFPQRLMGRGDVMAWPPRSPDLTSLGFYLWGYVKQHVYSERINVINNLKQRITDVIHSVAPNDRTRVWEELDYSLGVCMATNGEHIELRLTGLQTWRVFLLFGEDVIRLSCFVAFL